jgi:hypothetical protein
MNQQASTTAPGLGRAMQYLRSVLITDSEYEAIKARIVSSS